MNSFRRIETCSDLAEAVLSLFPHHEEHVFNGCDITLEKNFKPIHNIELNIVRKVSI